VEFDFFFFVFFCFLDKFAKYFNHQIEKKTPPTYGAIESAFLVTIFFKLENGGFGFSSHQNSKKKKEKEKSVDSIPSNSGK
jgi:hypothetical protein